MQDGDEEAQLFVDDDGGIGAHGIYGDASSPRCDSTRWHTVTCAVDAVGGSMRTYLDGEHVAEVKASKVCKDGEHALKGRLAVFYARNRACHVDYYLRSVTVHNRLLDAPQVRAEAEALHTMLIEDAIGATPRHLQSPLRARHAAHPFASTRELLAFSRALKKEAAERAAKLWRCLVDGDAAARSELMAELQPHDLAVAARWRRREAYTSSYSHYSSRADSVRREHAAVWGDAPPLRRVPRRR